MDIEDYKNILKIRERELDQVYELNLKLTQIIQDLEHEKEYWQTLFYRNRFPLLSLRNFIHLWMAKGLHFIKKSIKNQLRRMST